MTQEIINIGAVPNDGEGDPLRIAFQKINNNFTQLYNSAFLTSNSITVGNSTQVIYSTPLDTFTQGVFQVNSQNTDNLDSQNITLNASILNDGSGLKWNGHNTLFNGNYVTQYDMGIVDSNVFIAVTPITNSTATVFHFISAQTTWIGPDAPGLNIQLDGYTDGNVLSTENTLFIQTEQPAN
jgi:hypothetical protein